MFLILRVAASLLCLSSAAPSRRCRFALDFTCPLLQQDPAQTTSFLQSYAAAQSAFVADGVGLDAPSGLTFDGHPFDYATGALSGPPHTFSAASKECVHISLLALSLRGSPIASAAVGGPAAAAAAARRKLASFSRFNASKPGYGCHLPWFQVPSMAPTDDWSKPARVPALDNGELAWAVFALADALAFAGEKELAAGWGAWFTCMAGSAKTLFYKGAGQVGAVVVVRNVSAPPTDGNYDRSGPGVLNDPYEGETMTVLLDLFSPWPGGDADREQMWAVKRPQLQAVAYFAEGAGSNITAQRGFWFSAHENWKAALLPYLQVPAAAAVLESSEKARTWHAFDHGLPGLLASCTDLTPPGAPGGYISAAGIPQLAVVRGAYRQDVLAAYGAWMVLLHNASVGACWLRNVLAAPRMQGPFGASEAIAANGTMLASLATWDSTMTSVLTAAGGVGGGVGEALKRLPAGSPPPRGWETGGGGGRRGGSANDRFHTRMQNEYSAAFPIVEGGGAGFAVPAAAVPDGMPAWASCE